MGITLYELFDIDDPTVRFTAREQELLRKYREMSEGHKYAVDKLVDALTLSEVMDDRTEITELIYFSKTLAAGIGDPLEFEDEGTPIFLYSSEQVNNADYVFSVSGDSMEPEYHNEDMVLVKSMVNCTVKYGDVCAFINGNRTYIKEYQKDGLHSFNPNYPLMTFTEDDAVFCIGKVVGIPDRDSDIVKAKDVERYLAEREE
ncbi:MAG: helix-turn-helix transcriptional regulator [Ruminococcus sp.]|nr:helix-turn-helix transcriptional regulator [Ruminococcus sp.]